MTQEQAERALEQLYGDAGTRDELTDDEASVLLKWGEEQIHKLAAQNLDDAQFDEAFTHLTRLLARVNRFTARRAGLMPEEQHESLDKIAASAQAVAGYVPSAQSAAPPSFDAFLEQQGGLDNVASIQALTTLIAPSAPAAAAPAADTPDVTPPAAAAPPADTLDAAPLAEPPAADMPDAAPLAEPPAADTSEPDITPPAAAAPPADTPDAAPPKPTPQARSIIIRRPSLPTAPARGDDGDETQH